MTNVASPPKPAFREAAAFWLRLGFISFGGPAGQIALMHDFLVDKKQWISNSKFLHALSYCMLLPGPEAQQLATYTGWLLHGTRGGLVAGVLFVLPSAVLLWLLSALYVTYGQIPAIQSAFDFLKPAVVAVVAGAILKIGKKSLQSRLHYGVAIAAFVAIYFLKIPFPVIILAAVLLGAAFFYLEKTWQPEVEEMEQNGFSGSRLIRQTGMAFLLWAVPLVLFFIGSSNFAFWKKLCLFFTQAAFVTFGGAYAVLPYVAQVSVERFGWLSRLQMIDGLALGETTPGPLIMVLAFVGFMAGYNQLGGLTAATLGLAATVFYTFLPSFWFVFAGAPIIERTHSNAKVKAILQYVTAAVTGVILNLCLYLGKAVILPHPPEIAWLPLVWVLVSLLALQYFKVNLILWIGLSLAAGLCRYALTATPFFSSLYENLH